VITLALDTCDLRGSLALVRGDEVLHSISHNTSEDYSSWVLPAVERALDSSALKMRDVELYSVAAGPGSFTGLRIGLTSVKAWSEVYGGRVASISRLEAIASQAVGGEPFVAAFVDAQRDHIFGGAFRREAAKLQPVREELVVSPAGFLEWVCEIAQDAKVAWISMDPEKLTVERAWRARAAKGESIEKSSYILAPILGGIGLQRAKEGRLVDALALDAQYVRRSDAEIFWKGYATR